MLNPRGDLPQLYEQNLAKVQKLDNSMTPRISERYMPSNSQGFGTKCIKNAMNNNRTSAIQLSEARGQAMKNRFSTSPGSLNRSRA